MTGPADSAQASESRHRAEAGPFRNFVGDFTRSWLAVLGLTVFIGLVLLAVLSPLITQQNPYDLRQLSILDGRLPPGSTGSSGLTYWLGTDNQGRDMLSAILYGLRISLSVAVVSAGIAFSIGTVLGLCAAYWGGRVDAVLMRLVDLQLSFPSILVALVLLAALGRGVDKIVIALVIVQWAYYARTARGVALVERQKEYIQAARGLILGNRRIVFRHLLPNCMPPLIVVGTFQIAHAITLEATLSFLGVGLPVTEPSLGLLIANGFAFLHSGRYWISTLPGLALLLLIISINLVGDHLRDILNPRSQR